MTPHSMAYAELERIVMVADLVGVKQPIHGTLRRWLVYALDYLANHDDTDYVRWTADIETMIARHRRTEP